MPRLKGIKFKRQGNKITESRQTNRVIGIKMLRVVRRVSPFPFSKDTTSIKPMSSGTFGLIAVQANCVNHSRCGDYETRGGLVDLRNIIILQKHF